MKIKAFFITLSMAVAITAFIACGGNAEQQQDQGAQQPAPTESTQAAPAPHGDGAQFTSAYVCPMHCEGSGSDQAGKCPKCGMDYITQADHVKDGHKH
jgi:hypothetical protein